MPSVVASAPSNIALIKYMGKVKTQGNLPTNASLSYTLDSLRTTVRLTSLGDGEGADKWAALKGPEFEPLRLSEKGQERFLAHLQFLKAQWGIQQTFLVESANNFPSDCGLASSASSFAALTLAAGKMFQQIKPHSWGEDVRVLSSLSRQGSGSSCRSLYTPWALWAAEYAEPVALPYKKLLHQVIIVESAKKEISSSEAHKLVALSSLFPGRIERAEKRLKELQHSLQAQNWRQSFEIVWAEFWDMHALFATCAPPFMYMTSGSQRVLEEILQFWKNQGDGPLVTMDAGANVHFLWREDQKELAQAQENYWQSQFRVISSPTKD
ncbi:MAG TPA: diphosphomevalonate decarboxylase [Pseudobdellovibrionaceae bacterium]|jgi:diphosphomevalonate decarboxylase